MANYRNGCIRLIGGRASGKTTYLATLLYCPHRRQIKNKMPGFSIDYEPSSEAERLAKMAEDILKNGAKFAGGARLDVNYMPAYEFKLKIPAVNRLPDATVDFSVRDFAGEIFHDMALEHKYNDIQPYLNDLFIADKWMVMITDWEYEQDKKLYKRAFEKLHREIKERERINPEIKNLRIAVVLSKCERGELWPGRLEPDEDIFKVRLPQTYEFLSSKFPPKKNRLKFFACSSFGILDDTPENFDPRPNRYIPDDGSSADYSAFLRKPDQWKPFGILSPIYWLTTGKTLNDPSL